MLAAPAYSAEIAETKYRGALGTVMCLQCGLGILFINLNCNTDWRGDLQPQYPPPPASDEIVFSAERCLHHIPRPDGSLDDLHAKLPGLPPL